MQFFARRSASTNHHSWPALLMTLLLAVTLAACGGSGSTETDAGNGPGTGSGAEAPSGGGDDVLAPDASFNVEADRDTTSPGGATITLTADVEEDAGVEWSLGGNSPGELTTLSGNSAEYRPPQAGTVSGDRIVNVVASRGEASASIALMLNVGAGGDTGTPGAEPAAPPATPAPDDAGGGDAGDDGAATEPGIYLIAGNDYGRGMADGTGTRARFDVPMGVALDGQGNIYIADLLNYVIRRIDPQGQVSTLAGMPGLSGYADGSGAAARFSSVSGIAVDAQGNILVFDHGNSLLRRVTPAGEVTTVAGRQGLSGRADGSGDEVLFGGNPSALAFGPDGDLYIAEPRAVRRMSADGQVSTLATGFVELNGIAVDAEGVVYVTDGGWMRASRFPVTFRVASMVARIAPDGSVTTLAGTQATSGSGLEGEVIGYADGSGAEARFSYPQGLAIDRNGNLYVADRGNQVIRRITPQGVVSTVAGAPGEGGSTDGAAAAARFMSPAALTVDSAGILYLTDTKHHTVRRIAPEGSVTTIAGAAPLSGSADGSGTAARFNEPRGITRDAAGNLYVADSGNATIRRIAPDGLVSTLAGSAGQTGSANGTGAGALFAWPTDVAADALGSLFVADHLNELVRRIGPDGTVSTYAGNGQSGYVDGPAASAQFIEPRAVAVDADGNVLVVDRAGDAIRKITPAGIVSTLAGHEDTSEAPTGFGDGSKMIFPLEVAVDANGNAYAIDSNSAIRKIAPDGTMTLFAGMPFSIGSRDGTGTDARFNFPQSLTVDQAGNVYVADRNAIRRITPAGVVTTVAGPAVSSDGDRLRSVHRPLGLTMTGPNALAYTSGNGVFELRLP